MVALDDSLGRLFIANVVATALWGVTCTQTWHYFLSRPNDNRIIKCLVVAIWSFDTTHQAFLCKALYEYTITHFSDIRFLQTVSKDNAVAEIVLTRVTATIAQGFYIWKIWRLSERKLLYALPILVLVVVGCVLAVLETIAAARASTWAQLLSFGWPTPVLAYSAEFLTDGVIAVLMTLLLRANRSEYARTKSTVSKLVIFTLSTNSMTCLCALFIVITCIAFPSKLIFVAFFHVKIRLNTNSFLAALNMRPYFAGRTGPGLELDLSGMSFNSNGPTRRASSVGVRIRQEQLSKANFRMEATIADSRADDHGEVLHMV